MMDHGALDIEDQLFMMSELEKIKKENEEFQLYIERIDRERETIRAQSGKVMSIIIFFRKQLCNERGA